MAEHAMQKKLIITGTILLMMVGLLINTRFVPTKSKFADSSLNTAESFGDNSNATIMMTSRKYNKRQKFMVVKFTVKPNNNQLLDPNNIKFKVTMVNPQPVKYQVITLSNNQYVVVLNNLSRGFKAIKITAKNTQPDISQLTNAGNDSDVKIDNDGTASSSSSSTDDTTKKNSYGFVINESNKYVNNKLVKKTQKEYAIDSLNKSIKDVNGQIKGQKQAIKAYQKQITADNNSIQTTKNNAQYSVDNDDEQQSIQQAESDIKQQQSNIASAKKKITKYQTQVSLYQKQIRDINDGKYHFQAPVETKKEK